METSEESPENGVSGVNSPEDLVAMAATRKFLFDTIFDVEEAPEDEEKTTDEEEEAEPEVIVPTFSEEEMAAAREESFATGKAEGVNEAAEATERLISASLEKLSQQFDSLFKAQEKADAAIMENAISVACGIARKVFPALNQQGALGEIERMTVMSLEKILDEPQVIIAVNPELEAALNERLGTLTAQATYKGEVKIIADDGIVPGDCRIEWSGGGAYRDMDAMWREIDEIVERNLSGNPESSPGTAPETSKAAPEGPSETAGNDEVKADTEEVSGETPGEAPDEPLGEAAPGQAADTDPEPQPDLPDETPETPGDDEVKADTGEVSGETSGEAPDEPLGEAAPEQAADTDQEPEPGSSPGLPPDLPGETPETPGDEDTTTDQEDT